MQATQQLGAALGVAPSVFAAIAGGAGATTPEAFWAAIADAFVAATVFALLALALVVFVVRSPRP
jgi:hypothetical protein